MADNKSDDKINITAKILSQIQNNLNTYTFNDDTFVSLKKALNDKRFIDTTVCAKIKNGKLTIVYDTRKKETRRKDEIIKLVTDSIEHHNKKKITFPDVLFYLYVTDTYAYQYQNLPFFIMAKPLNKTGILIPDNTFVCHDVNKQCYSWTAVKDECATLNYNDKSDKKNVLFFAGANTDAGRQNIRSGLHKLELSNDVSYPLKILLQQPRLRLCEFKQFKYLLNLPGNQPWSYRFKYLFLMKSVVININVIQQYEEKSGWNQQWVNFFDVIFEKDVDYINIDYYWKEYDEDFNSEQFAELVVKLGEIYEKYEADQNAYEAMAQSGFDKVNMITNDLIYESIYMLFCEYAKMYDFSSIV